MAAKERHPTKHAFPCTSMAVACRAPPHQSELSSQSREKAEPFAAETAGHLIACTRSPLIYPMCTQVQTQRSLCFDAPAQGSRADVPLHVLQPASGSYQHHEALRQGSKLPLAEDEGTSLLWTVTAGPSSHSLQPPWSFRPLLSRHSRVCPVFQQRQLLLLPGHRKETPILTAQQSGNVNLGVRGSASIHSCTPKSPPGTLGPFSGGPRVHSQASCLQQASVHAALPTESRTHIPDIDTASQPQLIYVGG